MIALNPVADMKKKVVRLLFEAGDLTHCEVVPAVGRGWHIQMTRKNGEIITLEDTQGKFKWFGKVQTAIANARELGFERIGVYMPDMSEGGKLPPSPEDFKLQ